jgi:hypothetical protein
MPKTRLRLLDRNCKNSERFQDVLKIKKTPIMGKGSCAQKVKKMKIVVFDCSIKTTKENPKATNTPIEMS